MPCFLFHSVFSLPETLRFILYSYNRSLCFTCADVFFLLLLLLSISTVRVWGEKQEDHVVLEAHKPTVWAVAGLHEVDGSRRILSCETMGWRIRVLSGW